MESGDTNEEATMEEVTQRKGPKANLIKDRLVYNSRGYTLQECYKITDLNLLKLGTLEKTTTFYIMVTLAHTATFSRTD